MSDNTREYLAHISNFLHPCNQVRMRLGTFLLATVFTGRKQIGAGKKRDKKKKRFIATVVAEMLDQNLKQ